jgi:hypothetical protein
MYGGGYTGKILRINLSEKSYKESRCRSMWRRTSSEVRVSRSSTSTTRSRPIAIRWAPTQAHLRARSIHWYHRPVRQPYGRQRQVAGDRSHGRGDHGGTSPWR